MKKRSEETQTLRAGCSQAEPKLFASLQTPLLGARDSKNLISWKWSLPLPYKPSLVRIDTHNFRNLRRAWINMMDPCIALYMIGLASDEWINGASNLQSQKVLHWKTCGWKAGWINRSWKCVVPVSVDSAGFIQKLESPGIRPRSWKVMEMQIAGVTNILISLNDY